MFSGDKWKNYIKVVLGELGFLGWEADSSGTTRFLGMGCG